MSSSPTKSTLQGFTSHYARLLAIVGRGPHWDAPRPPGSQELSAEEVAILAAAIETLPIRTREVFTLHKFEQLSYAEIAEFLGIGKQAVVVHMSHALIHFHRQLADRPNT